MTQNDIAYYEARNQRRDMRLKRKETKRHNLASEEAARTQAAASYLGAQASQLSAQAATQNAATNRLNYQLNWETQYGIDYGKSPEDVQYVFWDITTGEKMSDNPNWKTSSRRKWLNDRKDDIIAYIPGNNTYGVPQDYIIKEIDIGKGQQSIRTQDTEQTKNFWQTIATGAKTLQIVVDTGRTIDREIQYHK